MADDPLFEQLASYENLLKAAYLAAKGRRRREYVIDFERNRVEEIGRLRTELISGSYIPGPYREFYVYEHKRRKISAAPFRDRVVHHALSNIIYPILDRRLGPTIFANRKGMGSQAAVLLAQRYMRRYRYFAKLDVRNYFPSIDHQILVSEIRRVIPSRRTVDLAAVIIDHSNPQDSIRFVFPGDDLFTFDQRRRGLPIGNLTSQHFANFYLHPLDHFIRERLGIRGYLRYVDDLLLFGDDKPRLGDAIAAIQETLVNLRLCLHDGRGQVTPTTRPLPYLGFVLRPDRIHIIPSNLTHARARSKRRAAEFRNHERDVAGYRSSVFGWLGYARLGGSTAAVRTAAGVVPDP